MARIERPLLPASQDLPRDGRRATHTEHIVFDTVAITSDLHEHVFTEDQLVAEFSSTAEQRVIGFARSFVG